MNEAPKTKPLSMPDDALADALQSLEVLLNDVGGDWQVEVLGESSFS